MFTLLSCFVSDYNVAVRLKRITTGAKKPKIDASLTNVRKEIQNYESRVKSITSEDKPTERIGDSQQSATAAKISQPADSQNSTTGQSPQACQLRSLNQGDTKVTTGYGIKGGQLICQICSETFGGCGAILLLRNHLKTAHKGHPKWRIQFYLSKTRKIELEMS